MKPSEGTVYIVDDDPDMRKALARLCRSAGLQPTPFASAREFLDAGVPEGPACLVLDVRMPGLSGLDLQAEMAARSILTPIVFITGHGDIPMSVRAIKAGAVDFLTKPFKDKNLVAVIRAALDKDVLLKSAQRERETIRRKLQSLTSRERQVFDLVIKGLLNKQIAGELGACEATIKVHRRRVMEKMEAQSVAELVQMAVKAGEVPS
ncbi:MAG TPA: response regulator transcription factor [Verrucomicrobiota bacterium]|nr:response regulator transcription factor [Verrucomicrobiota bacterium]HRZ35171.1 response regulator transcription factor [Candidatus Paceibacterota bacterium]HRZ54087.1 response regulator transcription factor [Candidatus Paceibacterota bacterium]